MYIMKVKPEYFEKIKTGKKIYEIRLLDDKRKLIKMGDTILLKKLPEVIEGVVLKVVDIRFFDTFKDMIKRISSKDLGYEDLSPDQIEEIYHGYYDVEEENEKGVVALKVERL